MEEKLTRRKGPGNEGEITTRMDLWLPSWCKRTLQVLAAKQNLAGGSALARLILIRELRKEKL